MTDSELLDQLRAGSHAAFDTIFRTHYRRLLAAAELITGDRSGAEEVVQDVMLELWRRRESLHIETSLAAYLFRAIRNRALNQIRASASARRTEPIADDHVDLTPRADTLLEHKRIESAVQEALQTLPPRCREVFERSRMQGLRYAEIAETLGISIKTVEAQMGKALRILRERLADWLPSADI